MKTMKTTLIALAVSVISPLLFAHSEKATPDEEMLEALENIEEKIVSLAEAMPEEVMDWAPAEGVRTTRESIMHLAGANYFFARTLGHELPEGLDPRKLGEGITSREETVKVVRDSFAAARNAIRNLGPAEMAGEVDFFGETTTRRFVAMMILSHGSEHLGQLIAYGRSNDVVPPWSR